MSERRNIGLKQPEQVFAGLTENTKTTLRQMSKAWLNIFRERGELPNTPELNLDSRWVAKKNTWKREYDNYQALVDWMTTESFRIKSLAEGSMKFIKQIFNVEFEVEVNQSLESNRYEEDLLLQFDRIETVGEYLRKHEGRLLPVEKRVF